jgi:hypothetical protein
MGLNKHFATGGFTLILTTMLLVKIVLGDLPKSPPSLLSADRSRLKGGVKSVNNYIWYTNQDTGKMYDPMYGGMYQFTQDGKPDFDYDRELSGDTKTEIKESGDITIASHYKSDILTSEERHVFDADGNIVESTPLYSNTGDYRKTVYIHEFDSHGNWIIRKWVKKGVDSSNRSSINPVLVEVRLITYY